MTLASTMHQPKTRRPWVLAALVVAMFMTAIEATIVATAMPSIAAKLGGLRLYSWVFSAFLLMQAVTIPIYGKLADLFGRKHVFIAGVLVFLLGSALCGFARSMPALIAFRFMQGLGAGAVQPLGQTLIGDLYSLEERGRVQGYMASVWGISAILGPLAGALIVQHVGWPWIFWVNLPFGAVAVALVGLHLHENVARKHPVIDYAGAMLMLAALSALMLALTQGGRWAPALIVLLLGIAAAAFALFVRHERRAPDPVMHLELWDRRLIRLANLATLGAGVSMIGVISFLPAFIQGVLHGSALAAGFALCAMSIGWPLAAVITGRALFRVGARRLARVGGAAIFLGSCVVAAGAGFGTLVAGAGSFLMGVGLGVLNTTFIVSIQTSVGWSERGVATASNILMRILGNALGAALFGGVLNIALSHFVGGSGIDSVSLEGLQDLLSGAPAAKSAAAGAAMQAGLATSLGVVFWIMALFAAATLAASWRMPDHRATGAPVRE